MGVHSTTLDILGPLRLTAGGRELHLPGHQLRALLTILGLAREAISRDRLASLLWPDVRRRTALHSLSQAVYRLAGLIGKGRLAATKDSVQLIGVDVDYYRLKEHVRDGNPLAPGLVRGHLAEGLTWSSASLQAWLERHRLDYARLLKLLSQRLERSCDWEALQTVAQVYSEVGGGEEAVRLANLAKSQVAARQESDPWGGRQFEDPEATSLFIGRLLELERLGSYWKEVLPSTGIAVIVTGPPGIGKTSLCYRFVKHVAVSGHRTLICRGFPTEQNLPFGVVGQLLADATLEQPLEQLPQPWRGIIAATFPSAGIRADFSASPEGAEAGHLAIYEALRQLIALAGRIVVFVDDADSCDPASLSFLHYLNRLGTENGIMVLLAAREPGLSALRSNFRNARLVTLTELTQPEVNELVLRLGARSGIHPPDTAFVFARSGGNPLFVQAVISHPVDLGSVRPDVFGDILRPRLAQLSANAQAVLAALSVAGERAEISLLAEVAGLDAEALAAALGELEAERLIQSLDNIFVSTHGLAGEVLLRGLPTVMRRLMYARVARSLWRSGSAPSAVLAVNYDIAGEPANAFEHAMDAAKASLRLYAYREAEYFLKLARSYAPSVSDATAILVELAKVYHRTGRFSETAAIPEPACGDDSLDAVALRTYLVIAQLEASREPDRFLPVGHSMIDLLVRSQDFSMACLLLSHMGRVAHDNGRIGETIALAERLLALARNLSDCDESQQFCVKAAGLLGLSRSMGAALNALAETNIPVDNLPVRISSLLTRASILVASGKLVDAERDFLETAALVERFGLYGHLFHLYNNFGLCYLEWGRYPEAEVLLRKAFDVSSTSWGDSLVAADNLGILCFETQRFEEALQLALQSLEANTPLRSPRSWFAATAMAGLTYLHLGKLAEAGECEREVRLALETYEYWLADISYVEVFLARMLVYRGHAGKAIDRLQDAAKRYDDRDFFCASRLRLELIRLQLSRNPDIRMPELGSFRERLVDASAYPLVEQLDRVYPGSIL